MKKSLFIIMVLVFVLGIASTAFAANSFVDVPTNHWAYKAIGELYKSGLIDGYGDGTFKGDKVLTRYELAMIVAKAMNNVDKADAAQKANLDKLQNEFATELNNLGVRVGKLEKNQPNLKFKGAMSMRYTAKDMVNDDSSTDNVRAQYRLRLEATAKVDDSTTFGMRLVNNSPYNQNKNQYGTFTNSVWNTLGSSYGSNAPVKDSNNASSVALDRVWFNTNIAGISTTVGRQQLSAGVTASIIDSNAQSFDGIKFAKQMGNVKATASWGRLVDRKDITEAEVLVTNDKLRYGGGYFGIQDHGSSVDNVHISNTNLGAEVMKLWNGNIKYTFTPKFSLTGEYTANNTDWATHDNKSLTVIGIYGDQSIDKAGDTNLTVKYYKVGASALDFDSNGVGPTALDIARTYLFPTATRNASTTYTGWDIGIYHAFSSGFLSETHYVKISDAANRSESFNYVRELITLRF
jgi:hypothetical protein